MNTIRSIAHPDRKARALAITICAIWETWSDIHEDARDDALWLAFEAVRAIDLTQACDDVAAPLGYFAAAYLDETNPADKTYDEMVQAIAEGLALASLKPRSDSPVPSTPRPMGEVVGATENIGSTTRPRARKLGEPFSD